MVMRFKRSGAPRGASDLASGQGALTLREADSIVIYVKNANESREEGTA